MIKQAKPFLVVIVLLIAGLACNAAGITDVSPQEHIDAVETLAVHMDTPAVALTPGFLTDTPTSAEIAATPVFFTSAVFYFFPDQATFSGVESVGSLLDFCAPPRTQSTDSSGYLTIGEFGAMTGQCSGDSTDKTTHREGTLTGVYNAETHLVAFRLETSKVFVPYPGGKATAIITFEGDGDVVGNTASGTGNFDYTCSAEGELVYCIDDSTTLQLNGTMPFQIVFSP